MISFETDNRIFFLPLLLIISATVALVLYFRNQDNKGLSRVQTRILYVLRFLSFLFISFFLLSPFIYNLKKIIQQPVIITAWDNSGSVASGEKQPEKVAEVNNLRQSVIQSFGNDYTLVNYTFGETVASGSEITLTEKRSDYSQLIDEIRNNHFNDHIGALIIAGDGLYNHGKNPVNMTSEIDYPVYTLALGDTTQFADAGIQGVRTNRTSFTGNQFPVEIDVHFTGLAGIPLKLSVGHEGEEKAAEIITPPNDNYFISKQFILESGSAGLKRFTARLEVADTEKNVANNVSTFVIQVLENKQKILILSEGPHPDIGAIRSTLEEQASYDVSLFTDEPYPSNPEDFNLVIMHQIPTAGKSLNHIFESAQKKRVPVLYIVGNRTFIPQFNLIAPGAKILPLAGAQEEAQPYVNKNYRTFTISDELVEMLAQMPPLNVPFADFETDAGFQTFLYQKIKNYETNKPLWITGTWNGIKTGLIFGEGIWRWRLFNYLENQTHDQFNELLVKTVQYLALKENEDNFMLDYLPVYAETDDIIIRASVYNELFSPITTEEVTLEITNENGEKLRFTFDKTESSYFLNAGKLPAGNYVMEAKVTVDNETFTKTGAFMVTPVIIENIVTRANHQVMYQLAATTGGKFHSPAEISEMVNEIKQNQKLKPAVYYQEMINHLLNSRVLFFVLLLILSMEWFLRKFWGIY